MRSNPCIIGVKIPFDPNIIRHMYSEMRKLSHSNSQDLYPEIGRVLLPRQPTILSHSLQLYTTPPPFLMEQMHPDRHE